MAQRFSAVSAFCYCRWIAPSASPSTASTACEHSLTAANPALSTRTKSSNPEQRTSSSLNATFHRVRRLSLRDSEKTFKGFGGTHRHEISVHALLARIERGRRPSGARNQQLHETQKISSHFRTQDDVRKTFPDTQGSENTFNYRGKNRGKPPPYYYPKGFLPSLPLLEGFR